MNRSAWDKSVKNTEGRQCLVTTGKVDSLVRMFAGNFSLFALSYIIFTFLPLDPLIK
jgi:hypothetical protein